MLWTNFRGAHAPLRAGFSAPAEPIRKMSATRASLTAREGACAPQIKRCPIDLSDAAAIFIDAKTAAFGWHRVRKKFIIRHKMKCPHCQQVLLAQIPPAKCPFCGKPLPQRILAFFAVLLTPAVCSFIASALKLESLAAVFGLAGSLVSGLICTRILAHAYEVSGARYALIFFFTGVVLCGFSCFLSFLVADSFVSRLNLPILWTR